MGGEGGPHDVESAGGVRVVVVEEKRNIIVGFAIFFGFFAFFALDKTMRLLNAGDGDEEGQHAGHSHSHSHSHGHKHGGGAVSSAIESPNKDGLKSRKGKTEVAVEKHLDQPQKVNASLKLSAYLNLFGDFS